VKILLALESASDARTLSAALEELGHRILIGSDLNECAKFLRCWLPDMIVADVNVRRDQPESGLRLAELCRINSEGSYSSSRTHTLVLLPIADWDLMTRARSTGAQVVVRGKTFDAVVRYVETAADQLATERALGPVLLGIHRFSGEHPQKFCPSCEWEGASVLYGTSETDISLTPVRAAILNALFRVRRGQSAIEISRTVNDCPFLKPFLRSRILKESAVKMEITRLRQDLGKAVEAIGAPYSGEHFLPFVPHGVAKYRLAGTWRLFHISVERTIYAG